MDDMIHLLKNTNIKKYMNNNILSVIARYADIDTRRAMGFPPRKLDLSSWKEFEPKGFSSELYRYFVNEKRLEYFEMWEYGCIYYDVVTDVEPGDIDSHMWITLSNSVERGVFQSPNRTDVYVKKRNNELFHTAGWPVFVT